MSPSLLDHVMLRILVCIALCVTAAPSRAQAPLPVDSVQSARLAAIGRLWGSIKFFHPYLASRPIDWDAALVSAVPRVIAARSAADYRDAVNGMLSSLGDASTYAEVPAEPGAGTRPDTVPVRLERGVLRVDVGSLARILASGNDAGRGYAARIPALLDSAAAVLVDVRGSALGAGEQAEAVQYHLASTLNEVLQEALDTTIVLASLRSRMHSGFAPQSGRSSGGYYSALATTEPGVIVGRGTRRIPITVLIDRGTDPIVEVLAGLSASGRGRIVKVGEGPAEVGVPTYAVALTDGVRARFRTVEIVMPSGQVGFSADTVIAASAIPRLPLTRRPTSDGRAAALAAPPPLRPTRDEAYASTPFPDFPHRLLALFRFWCTIEYFHPYRRLIDEPWEDVLPRYVPRFAANRDAADYQQTVREMVAETQDSHAGVGGATQLRERRGTSYPPIATRTVEGETVITVLLEPVPGLAVGDVVVAIDGEPIQRHRDRVAAITAASTPQAFNRVLQYEILRGAPGSVARLSVRSPEGPVREVEVTRSVPGNDPRWADTQPTHRTTPTFGVLPSGYGYVDLNRLQVAEVDSMFRVIAGTPATIFDMRGYPNGTAWPIAPRLTTRRHIAGPLFSRPMLDGRTLAEFDGGEPGSFTFVQYLPPPDGPPYLGKVAMLIDENAQSQSEHTAMFFEAATDVTFIGTPTAGANGDVTTVVLPGGLTASFSGHEVRHPDGRQLQRVGIQPHVRVAPTIRGIVAHRDEVLEAAIQHLQRTLH